MIKIGIIGSAGRDTHGELLGKFGYSKAWEAMYEYLCSMIKSEVHLISGGAAWADHLAIRFFLEGKCKHLTLHLPAKFNKQYDDTKCGKTANYYHRLFSEQIGENTLEQVQEAIKEGAIATYQSGTSSSSFFARNTLIAEDSDGLIALTYSDRNGRISGGTADTWRKFQKLKPKNRAVFQDLYHLLKTS